MVHLSAELCYFFFLLHVPVVRAAAFFGILCNVDVTHHFFLFHVCAVQLFPQVIVSDVLGLSKIKALLKLVCACSSFSCLYSVSSVHACFLYLIFRFISLLF